MYEEENTVRALSDQPLLATGRWCWLGFHKWSMYSEALHRQEGVWEIDYQVRHCVACGELAAKILRRY